jgi:hypothetical protein
MTTKDFQESVLALSSQLQIEEYELLPTLNYLGCNETKGIKSLIFLLDESQRNKDKNFSKRLNLLSLNEKNLLLLLAKHLTQSKESFLELMQSS